MAFVFKSSLRWKLVRVRTIDDIDRNLVLTDLVYKGTSIGSHPVFFFKLEIKKPKFSILAIVGTSDGRNNRLKDPERYHHVKRVTNNALDHDTYFDLKQLYTIDEKTLFGLELKVLGRLSTNDSIEMIRKVIEKISFKKVKFIKAKIIQ